MVQRDLIPEGVNDIEQYKLLVNALEDSVVSTATTDISSSVGTFASDVSMGRVNQVDVQFFTDDGDGIEKIDTLTQTGSANTSLQDGARHFSTGTDSTAEYTATSKGDIEYASAREIFLFQTFAWQQPPTSASDKAQGGLYNPSIDEGYMWGYKGTEFGIAYYRNGTEQNFIPQSEFNSDKLDGNDDSDFTRNGKPEAIDTSKLNVFQIKFGWLGSAPTTFEIVSPDGEWITVHRIDHPNDKDVPQITNPNMPATLTVEKNNSDSTDIEMSTGCWGGGIVAQSNVAQQPDGDLIHEKATGEAFHYDKLLTANEELVGEWHDTDGWGSIGINVVSDQPSAENGLIVEYTHDANEVSPHETSSDVFTYTQDLADKEEALHLVVPTEMDGFRVRYINGDTGQNNFHLIGTLVEEVQQAQATFGTPIDDDVLGATVRSILSAENLSGGFQEIKLGPEGGLRTSTKHVETDFPIRSDDKFDTTAVAVPDIDGGGPIQPLDAGLSNRTKIRVSNDGDSPVYIGNDSTLTPDNGYSVESGDEETFPLTEDPEFWMVAADGTGGSTTHKLDATAATGSVAAPEDTKTSDDVRATFQNNGDYVDASGYDASGAQTRNEVSSVHIGFEGKKPSLTSTKQVSHAETTTNARNGGTSITTNVELAADADSSYLVFVSVNPASVNIDNVQGLGLNYTLVKEIASGGNEQDIALYKATGAPDSSGRVTANFDAEADSSTIVASRYDNVKNVEASATNIDNTVDWSVTTPDSSANGLVISGATINKETSNTPNAGEDELAEETPASMTTAVQKDTTNGGSVTSGGTWGQNGKWSAIGAALEPEELDDPLVNLEYEVGTEGVGATTLSTTLTTETDTEQEKDVTSDRTWTYTDLDNTTVTLTYNNTDRYNALIDHIYLEYTEVDTGVTQRVSFMETGRTGNI